MNVPACVALRVVPGLEKHFVSFVAVLLVLLWRVHLSAWRWNSQMNDVPVDVPGCYWNVQQEDEPVHGDQHQHGGETLSHHLWNHPLNTHRHQASEPAGPAEPGRIKFPHTHDMWPSSYCGHLNSPLLNEGRTRNQQAAKQKLPLSLFSVFLVGFVAWWKSIRPSVCLIVGNWWESPTVFFVRTLRCLATQPTRG